jgi:hypothetical protein
LKQPILLTLVSEVFISAYVSYWSSLFVTLVSEHGLTSAYVVILLKQPICSHWFEHGLTSAHKASWSSPFVTLVLEHGLTSAHVLSHWSSPFCQHSGAMVQPALMCYPIEQPILSHWFWSYLVCSAHVLSHWCFELICHTGFGARSQPAA